MNGCERVLVHLNGQPVDRLPLPAITTEVDSLTPKTLAREQMPRQIILGNLNPVALFRNGTPEVVTEGVAQCHRAAGARCIVGAGCGIPRDTPGPHFQALCDYARLARP
jgi:uroporphyrinogen-III decarboxylase